MEKLSSTKPSLLPKRLWDHWQDKVGTLCRVTPPTSLSSASLSAQSLGTSCCSQMVSACYSFCESSPGCALSLECICFTWSIIEEILKDSAPSFTSSKPAWWPPLMHPRVPCWARLTRLEAPWGQDHFQIVSLSYSLYKWTKWALIVKKKYGFRASWMLGS